MFKPPGGGSVPIGRVLGSADGHGEREVNVMATTPGCCPGCHRAGRGRPARSRRGRLAAAAATAALAALAVPSAADAASYPDPPPDFAHPSDPHRPFFTFEGGRTDRPMLVLYAQFADLTYDDTSPAGLDAQYMADRFFGPFPSVADYFADDSSGQLRLTPAAESDASNGGAVDDGVVAVTVDMDKADFIAQGRATEVKALLQLADPFVDYAGFDTDGDGRLTQDELVVHRHDVDADPVGPGSGTARGIDPVVLDGVQLGDLKAVNAGTDTNLLTLAHETGHTAFDMPDLYFWGVGSLDLAGPTAGTADSNLFRVNAWQKLHIGWTTPTVVTQDGFYDVPVSPTATGSFVLYDPDRGTDDFFVVENRARTPGTYDQAASDTGLVVWRIDDDEFVPAGGGNGPIALMRPDGQPTGNAYGGSSTDAWDPADARTPQRTMAQPWRDGTPSGVAVRAIPAADDTMRPFFDVRGPGILVDALDAEGRPVSIDVTPDEVNRPPVTVMNTGEEPDTFEFAYESAPDGWQVVADEQSLGDHEQATAQAALIPDADAPTGSRSVTIAGRSTTHPEVAESASFQVNVVLDETAIDYLGGTRGRIGEPAGFAARLTNPDDDGAPPIEDLGVTFELSGPGGTLSATAATGVDGIAEVGPTLDLPPGDYVLTVSTPRFGKHAPASATVGYHILTAAERVAELRDAVLAAGLSRGIERSLVAKLDRALAALESDRTLSACGLLSSFVNELAALRGRHVPAATADGWTAEAEGIRAQIGCRP